MTLFFNPYDFVPVQEPKLEQVARKHLGTHPRDHQHLSHDRYLSQATLDDGNTHEVFSGRVLCTLRLQTPTVIGANRELGTEEKAAIVHPFEIAMDVGGKKWQEPAIPDSSLRGMISSLVETATSSALRVLHDESLSMRVEMSESLQPVGMIVERNNRRMLLPLTYPFSRDSDGRETWPHLQLKIYVDNSGPLSSFSPDIREVIFLENASAATDVNKGGLIAKRSTGGKLIPWAAWHELSETEQARFTPGVLRRLKNTGRDLPSQKKHEWFIPLSPKIYNAESNEWTIGEIRLLDAEDASSTFEAMALERTRDKTVLPYEVVGSARNPIVDRDPTNPKDYSIQLREGDQVCFRLNGDNIDSLAISSIWRRPAGNTHGWFANVHSDLVPMKAARENITLAEQIFGFVQTDAHKQGQTSLKNLAGRVRFSDARLIKPRDNPYLPAVTLKILAGPKPPCPNFYFKPAKGQYEGKNKFPRAAGGSQRPLGRKVYLHHDPSSRDDPGHADWESQKADAFLKQKAKVTPLQPGTEFCFDISFDNLSDLDLGILLYALRPTEEFRHRLGMGKPLGLGTVEVRPVALFLVDRHKRYAQDDPFTVPRYYHVEWRNGSDASQLFDQHNDAPDVFARYRAERQSAAASPSPMMSSLATMARQKLLQRFPDVIPVLESLGNPQTTAGVPVHYPRLPKELSPDTETEFFRWFVWNEHRAAMKPPRSQHLEPLNGANPIPAKLDAIAPFFFFLYRDLPPQAADEVYTLLETHYPNAYHPARGTPCLARSTDYGFQVLGALANGLIPVHVGLGSDSDCDRRHWVDQHKPDLVVNRNGDPLRWNTVVRNFKKKYLPWLEQEE